MAQTAQAGTVPDAQIEAGVLKAFADTPQLANENIITNTVYGTVTLSGSVKDEPTRQLAENLAAKTSGVKKVVDELTLGSTTDASAQQPQGGVPMSDGSMSQGGPQGTPQAGDGQAHAPDPDTYAAQHGYGADTGQNNPPDTAYNNAPPQPGYDGNQPPQPGYGPAPSGAPYPQQRPAPNGQPRHTYGAQEAGQPVTVPPGSLLRIRINQGLDTKHTQPGNIFDATVLNDVVADGAVAIPRGATVQGVVVDSKASGAIKGHAQLQLQLTQVTLGGKVYPLVSDLWTRESMDKSGQTVGSAVGMGAFGAIIGAIAGGGPGAAIGAAAGGAAGVGASAASGNRQLIVPAEAILTFHLTQPAPMTTVSQAEMDRLSYGVPSGQAGPPRMMRRYPPPPPGYGGYGPVYYYPY
ncbi:MAG TPA: BON domain-containing protein [Granulicella sp.]